MTFAPPLPTDCNQRCGMTLPHGAHLFLGSGPGLQQFALRAGKHSATVLLPDGTRLTRSQPGAIRTLKLDVQLYFERLGLPA